MILTRIFLALSVLALIVGCGKEKQETEIQQPASQPQPITQQKDADALFDEFFDGSSSKAPEPKEIETAPVNHDFTFSQNGRYVVQVSTIASSTLADEIAKKLEKKGFPAYVVSVENPTTQLIGTYYRVRIGGFDNSADAKYFGDNMLRPLGYDFWVDTRSNDRIGAGAPATSDYDNYASPTTDYPQATDYNDVKEEDWAPATETAPVETTPAEVAPVETAPATAPEIQPAPAAQPADSDTGWGEFAW